MKHKIILLIFLAVAAAGFASAPADAQVTVQEGTTVRELPGNATIVTGNGGGPNGVLIYNNDDSLLYRTLVSPRYRNGNGGVNNSSSMNDVQSICGHLSNISDKNKCIKDVLDERKKLQRRYNN